MYILYSNGCEKEFKGRNLKNRYPQNILIVFLSQPPFDKPLFGKI
ncbi:hypothetical protein Pint_12104 [Pistacia integerrima]|uniref:Uncharacterized protein n=1 Tax=Pistacia integerrima TaxID=434235 RepID=A0ACC0XIS1_9ROSI|nr:hypothetical protein Pint_12104 [Pistacia integerrima]